MSFKMAFRSQILELLKEKKAISLADVSKTFNVPATSLQLILADIESLTVVEGNLLLKGLGQDKCISCGEKTEKTSDKSFAYRLSEEDLKDYNINASYILKDGVLGHKACFEKMGVFSRISNSKLSCGNCSSFDGEWVDADEVKETCSKLTDTHYGHRGYIASGSPCTFYSVTSPYNLNDPSAHEGLVVAWNEIKEDVHTKTKENLHNLVQILEDAKLIQKRIE